MQPEEVRTVPVAGEQSVRTSGLLTAGRRVLDPVGLALVLLVVAWWWYLLAVQGSAGDWAFDFRQFWQGAKDVVDGVSPYPGRALLETAGAQLDPAGIQHVFRFPYPAGAAIFLAPLGLLGFHAAAAIWSVILIASLLGAVWILGVRDWRVLAIVVSSAPVLTSVRLGSFTPILLLLLAIAWRWRDRPWVAGGSLALAIALKVFVWPLVVWLAVTRRYAAAGIAAAGAAVVTLGAWTAIGFRGLSEYPELVRRLTSVVEGRGYSLVALGLQLDLPHGVARALPWLVGLALLGWAALAARRGADERATFSVAVVAAVALTPIVWLHYFALLLVVVALARPTLGVLWFVPLAMIVTPGSGHPTLFESSATLVVAAVTTTLALRSTLGNNPGDASPQAEPA